MQSHKYLPNYTIEDYNRWEGDWELINGIPYAMSPAPTRKHQRLASQVFLQIGNSIDEQKEKCGDCEALYECDWILSNNTVVRPDIIVTCDKDGDSITTPPILVVEILSPSTGLKDRHLKFELYQEEGVKYYIIADPNSKTYQVYVLNEGRYEEQKNLTSFIIHGKCAIELNLEDALAKLPDLA